MLSDRSALLLCCCCCLQELLSLRALSQAVLGKDVWLALDQAHQLLVKGVQRPPVEEALRLAFLHMVEGE